MVTEDVAFYTLRLLKIAVGRCTTWARKKFSHEFSSLLANVLALILTQVERAGLKLNTCRNGRRPLPHDTHGTTETIDRRREDMRHSVSQTDIMHATSSRPRRAAGNTCLLYTSDAADE